MISSLIQFQFQCGAIGSSVINKKAKKVSGFNSSVVRLVAKNPTEEKMFLKFQFQCGAIGSVLCRLLPFLVNSFNSSVVRLVEKFIYNIDSS